MVKVKKVQYNEFRLLSFEACDANNPDDYNSNMFKVKMFGVNEKGQTACINVTGYTPFFYVKVDDDWDDNRRAEFINNVKGDIGDYLAKGIVSSQLIQHKKLYGFDDGRKYNFVKINFANELVMKKTKNLWYKTDEKNGWHLNPEGYLFETNTTLLYEAQIPPLLRLFHIKEMSPSGWIGLPRNDKTSEVVSKTANCNFEFEIDYKYIVALPKKETRVPYKICSFDIEASSSHGDVPLAVKEYEKLATNIVDVCRAKNNYSEEIIKQIIWTAFGYAANKLENVDKVYPIIRPSLKMLETHFAKWIQLKPANFPATTAELGREQPSKDDSDNSDDSDEDDEGEDEETGCDNDTNEPPLVEEATTYWRGFKNKVASNKSASYKKSSSIIDLLQDTDLSRVNKISGINRTLLSVFPKLNGDNVTFIGSTFVRYGEDKPYLNHCIVRDTCNPVPNAVIESYKTEKEVLLAWVDLIQKENPDIIIGYNIFGFDYQFMYQRAKELD
jgi:DNA polymerase elongation subunit (family B)